MKLFTFTLAAMLLATAAASSGAAVPVIVLATPSLAQVRPAPERASAPQLVGQRTPAPAMSAPAVPKSDSGEAVLVAVRPQPSWSALVLLALGCVIYLGRRRRQGFALRPSRSLFKGQSHAPASA